MPSVHIKMIPTKQYNFIYRTQAEMKIKKKCGQYSLSQTVLHLLEECERLKELEDSLTRISALTLNK